MATGEEEDPEEEEAVEVAGEEAVVVEEAVEVDGDVVACRRSCKRVPPG